MNTARLRRVRPGMVSAMTNVDHQEIGKFSELASRWWDPEGEFKPLHQINPLRLDFINQNAQGLSASELLDVFNTFNITKNLENIEYLREVYLNTKPSDNIDLVRMKRLSKDLQNVNFVNDKYLVGVINLKPSMTHTLIASMLAGLFLSITYIYLYLLNAKKPILKRIRALRNLI